MTVGGQLGEVRAGGIGESDGISRDFRGGGLDLGVQGKGLETAMTKPFGVILIALGLVGLIWGGVNYTTKETVVDIGPIQATRDKNHRVPLPPVAGAVAVVGGVLLLVIGKNG